MTVAKKSLSSIALSTNKYIFVNKFTMNYLLKRLNIS